MELLKNGTELCPYCHQPLEKCDDRYYCHTEGCGKTFDIYDFGKDGE